MANRRRVIVSLLIVVAMIVFMLPIFGCGGEPAGPKVLKVGVITWLGWIGADFANGLEVMAEIDNAMWPRYRWGKISCRIYRI